MRSKSHTPPPGWTLASGMLQPDRSIAGYALRGQDVNGRCYQRDCRRSCHIDHKRIIERGLGALQIEQVKRTFRCSRLDHCAIEWHEDLKAESVQLGFLAGRAAVVLVIRCAGCGASLEVPPEAMIARLVADKRGGATTRTHELPDLLSGACKACGKTQWTVAVKWPDPNTWGGQRAIDLAARTPAAHKDPLEF